jgi:hypothetical protein
MENGFEESLRAKLNSYSEEPPSEVWSNIEETLDSIHQQPDGLFLPRLLSGLDGLALLLIGMMLLMSQPVNNQERAFASVQTESTIANAPVLASEENNSPALVSSTTIQQNNTTETSKMENVNETPAPALANKAPVSLSKPDASSNEIKDNKHPSSLAIAPTLHPTDLLGTLSSHQQPPSKDNTPEGIIPVNHFEKQHFYLANVRTHSGKRIDYYYINNLKVKILDPGSAYSLIEPRYFETEEHPERNKYQLAIDAFYSFNFNYNKVSSTDPSADDYVRKRSESENPHPDYALGMRVSYTFYKNLYLQTGFQFQRRSEKFNLQSTYKTYESYIDSSRFITIIDPQGNPIEVRQYDTLNAEFIRVKVLKHQVLTRMWDLPLIIGTRIKTDKVWLYAQGGVILNAYRTHKGTFVNPVLNEEVIISGRDEASYRTKIGAALYISGGIEWPLTKNLSILTEPGFFFYPQSAYNRNLPVKLNWNSYQLSAAIRYKPFRR